jgi:hypothetical protein
LRNGLAGRQQFRGTANDRTARLSLNATQILANAIHIAAAFLGMFHAVTPNFLNDGIIHRTISNNSSGKQSSGHR